MVMTFRAIFSTYSRNSVKLPRYIRRAMGQRGYLTAIVTRDGRIIPAMAGASGDPLDENELRQALGIGEDADVTAEITNLQDRIKELEATIATDGKATEKAEVAQLRRDLGDAEKRYLSQEADWQKRLIALEEENRREKAERMVDAAVASGRVQPALRGMALKLALRDPKDFEEFAAKLPGIDLTERGVATDADLAGLEPTATELVVAKQLGISRVQLIKQKAADKGIDLPADFDKDK
jgi:phage I-like protein